MAEEDKNVYQQGTARWPASGQGKSVETEEGYIMPAPKPSVKSDVAKSVAAQGALGVADIPGMVGGLGQLFDTGVGYLTGYLPLRAAEATGLLPSGAAEKKYTDVIKGSGVDYLTGYLPLRAAEATGLLTSGAAEKIYIGVKDIGKTPAEKKGYVYNFMGVPLPTPAGMQNIATRVAPSLGYQPQTREGEIAGSMTRFGTSMLGPGGWKKRVDEAMTYGPRIYERGKEALQRMGIGAIMGGGAEAGSELAQRSDLGAYDPLARFAGSVAPLVAGKVSQPIAKKLLFPEQAAEATIADAMRFDRSRGAAGLTQDQIDRMQAYGEHPTVVEAGGPQTRSLVTQYSGEAPEQYVIAQEYFRNRADRLNLPQWMSDTFNIPESAGDQALLLQNTRRQQNNINYGIARANPATQSMWSSGLEKFANDPLVKPFIDKVNQYAKGKPRLDANGVPIPNSEIVGYSPATAAFRGTAPNLNFWHEVKSLMDDEINRLRKTEGNTFADVIDNERKQLLNEVGAIVPEYSAARIKAHELFKTEDAFEAGFKLFDTKNVINNSKKLAEALKLFGGNQKDVFESGLMSYLKTYAEKNGSGKLTAFLANPDTSRKLTRIIGKDKYNQILNAADADVRLAKGSLPDIGAVPSPVKKYGTATGAGVALGSGIQFYLWSNPSLTNAVYTAIATGAPIVGKAILNRGEKLIAPQVMKILRSNDPKRFEQLNRLAQERAEAGTFVGKLNWAASRLAPAYVRANPLPDQRKDDGGYKMEILDAPLSSPEATGNQSSLSPSNQEIDLATRMILGEAGNQSDEGKMAVMHTALNRAKKSGRPLNNIINEKNAFESVTSGRVSEYSPDSKQYQYVRDNIVLPSLQGKTEDPTGGATFFLNPDLQRELGRNRPKWASGEGKRIGSHVFYNLPFGSAENRAGRASGGRIMSHKSEAERLMNLADKAKKALNNSTESLLAVPDEAVTKALSIANEAI